MLNTESMEPFAASVAAHVIKGLHAGPVGDTMTMGELWQLYYERKVCIHHKSDANAKYWWSAHGPKWKDRQAHTISRHEVQEWVDSLAADSPSAAWRAVSVLSAVLNWGMKREYIPSMKNPCAGVEKPKLKSRSRFLKPHELARFIDSLQFEQRQFKDFFALALLTGARKGNLMAMKWSAIDFDLATWTIPAEEFKNGDEHVVPLNKWALPLLYARYTTAGSSPWVFPSDSKSGHMEDPKTAWKRITKRAGLENLHIHDLRRTLASYMAMKGQGQYVIGKLLGHKDHRSTAVYARLDVGAVRTSLDIVGEHWQGIISQPQKTGPRRIEGPAPVVARQSSPKASNSGLSPKDQVIVEAKILTAMQWGGDTKKDFYSKIGSQVKLNAAELQRVLSEMEAKGLIESELTAGNITRYKIKE
jgi:integrase